MVESIKLNKSGNKRGMGRKKWTPTPIPCPVCGVIFLPRNKHIKTCSPVCRGKAISKHHRENVKNGGILYGNKGWTKKEDQILVDNYSNLNLSFLDIQKLLPNRTIGSIKHRVWKLKIWSDRPRNFNFRNNPFYGKHHSDKTKQILSDSLKINSAYHRLNKDPEFQKKRRKNWNGVVMAYPNNSERILGSILDHFHKGKFKFVGDGSFLVETTNPDFVWEDGKKIVELFGRAFHDPKYCSWELTKRSTEEGRRELLERNGFKMLVVWDDELKTTMKDNKKLDVLILKINNFVKS